MLTAPSAAAADYQRDLGNGLVLRWSTVEDTEKIVQLVGHVFRDKEDEPPNPHLSEVVRRLMRGDHPLMGSNDYGIVEDTSKADRPIVACTCLWRQRMEYEGVAFSMGRPEIVATHGDYRNRGLVRALFDMIHARSEAEGHLVQGITGIPYFYRQFGYEYALDLGGGRKTYLSLIPKAKEDTPEPYTLREATAEDIPVIMECYNYRRGASMIRTDVPADYWRYEIEAWKTFPGMTHTSYLMMIVDATQRAVGYMVIAPRRWGSGLTIWAMDIARDINLQAMMPPVLRALQAFGPTVPTRRPDTEAFTRIEFDLGRSHPVYDVLGTELAPRQEAPYAWYIRVADVPGFLLHIAPVLERRLANSPLVGYTGELKIDFYRSGLRMVFEQGCLTTAEKWILPVYNSNANAGFPPLVFLQLLFGHRSLDDLRYAFPDVWTNDDVEVVLKTLFPARLSQAWPL